MDKIIKKLKIDETFTKAGKKQKVFNKVKNNIPLIEDFNFMADLLLLPETKEGFKYLLVVVDLATDEFDIEPLKNKTPADVLNGIKKMIKRKYIKKPYASIRTDDGNEFKGVFHKWLYDNSILHKVALAGRHKQLGNVEVLNSQLGRLFNGYMNMKEEETKKIYKEWTDILNFVRKELNAIRKKELNFDVENYPAFDFKKAGKSKYKIGDLVYEKLDHPQNALGQKQPTANFRVGDYRYSKQPKKIIKIIYMNDEPFYRYMLEGIKNASYSSLELMPSKAKK